VTELYWLSKWFESHAAELSAAGIKYSCFVERTETDNPASTFQLDAERWVANVSLWESGACDFEAGYLGRDQELVNEHREVKSEEELVNFLSQIIFKL
jgi:hypothetical protein